jgi:hypothetical protein
MRDARRSKFANILRSRPMSASGESGPRRGHWWTSQKCHNRSLHPLPHRGETEYPDKGAAHRDVPKSPFFRSSAHAVGRHQHVHHSRSDRAVCAPRVGPGAVTHDENETSAPQISASGRGCRRAAGGAACCAGASLSNAAGAHHRPHGPRRRARHSRAAHRAVALGAARPAIRGRKPPRERQQYRHRSGGAGAAGRLHAPHCQLVEHDQRDALRQAQFRGSCATSRRSRASSASPS